MNEIYFTYERSTKRAYRFKECDKNGNVIEPSEVKIGTLYVKQVQFAGMRPKMLRVTIEEVK